MKHLVSVCRYLGLALVLLGTYFYATEVVTGIAALITLLIGAAMLATFAAFEWGMVKATLKQRSTRYGVNAAAMVLILIGILSFLNLIGSRYSKRIDTTATQRFSLSDLSTNVLTDLNQDIHIIGFFRSADPEASMQFALSDLLNQYQYHSRHITYEFFDPVKEPSVAKQYNIAQSGTVVFESEGKVEHITKSNEEAITNALVKVTRGGQKTIYFLTGHGEHDINITDHVGFSQLNQSLINQSYSVSTLSLLTEMAIPSDCNVLIVAGPKKSLLAHEQKAIAQYLHRGGRALFMLNPDSPLEKVNLGGLLDPWYVTIGDNVVVDASATGRMIGMGPLAPVVSNFPAHPLTRNLTPSVFPGVRSMEAAIASDDTVEIQIIAMTSDRSWAETRLPQSMDEAKEFTPELNSGEDQIGPISVALAITAVPRAVPRRDMATLTPQEIALRPEEHEVKTRIVAVGNSTFAANAYFRQWGNGDFVMNAINWLAEEEDLIAIRPKSSDTRLVQISTSQLSSIMIFTLVIAPLSVLLIGGIVYWRRR
ncbi:MAG: Gldg family protein [Gemmatimonadota bacterium]|nr:Gldg family protein [Gemmatimonadota bacterium]